MKTKIGKISCGGRQVTEEELKRIRICSAQMDEIWNQVRARLGR